MSVRRIVLYAGLTFSLSSLAFSLGSWTAQRSMAQQIADNDARLSALQEHLARGILRTREDVVVPSGTDGQRQPVIVSSDGQATSALVDEIKRQLQAEMGLLPVQLLRDRRQSFVELNAYDNNGKASYGTAGYVGNGYFITVKHGVVPLDEPEGSTRRFEAIKLRINGKDVSAKLVDTGDAPVEVHAGEKLLREDTIGHWFAVILGETDRPAAQEFEQRLRSAIGGYLRHRGLQVHDIESASMTSPDDDQLMADVWASLLGSPPASDPARY